MDGRPPDFLIVGAQKAGTTSLFYWLRSHPQVYLPPRKELAWLSSTEYEPRAQWYREIFGQAQPGAVAGEATPQYMLYPECAPRMAAEAPDARLIAVLREPISRAYSQHRMFHARFAWDLRDFDQVVDDELRTLPEEPPQLGLPREHPRRWEYVARGDYITQLERICEHFPREQLLVLLTEDLRDDPVGSFRTICAHLGVDDSIVPGRVGEVEHAAFEVRIPRLYRVIDRYSLRRRKPRLAGLIDRVATRPARPAPPMSDHARERLREFYAPRNEALAKWLGRDLTAWQR